MQAFSLFSIIIDRLQDEVRPFAGGILHLLPEVWSDAEGQSLMRIQVQAPLGSFAPSTMHGPVCGPAFMWPPRHCSPAKMLPLVSRDSLSPSRDNEDPAPSEPPVKCGFSYGHACSECRTEAAAHLPAQR